jgi:hypothetical protein
MWVTSAIAALVLAGTSASAQSQSNKLRIGVYDSRAVAVAYCSSAEFREAMKTVKTDYDKARAARDEKRMKELEARMKAQQRRQHEQGFSTGSVAPIIAKLESSLPAVAEQAGVQVIVSKWELNYRSPAAEVVDVTDQIVALFKVDQRALKQIEEIQAQPPLPPEKLNQ